MIRRRLTEGDQAMSKALQQKLAFAFGVAFVIAHPVGNAR